MRRRALIPALGLVVIAAGCGGTSEDVPPSSSPVDADVAAAATVVMGDFSYTPSPLTVRVGEPVTFVNRGEIDHTVADTDAAGAIRSTLIMPRPIGPRGSQVVTFATPGTVDYICTYHPTLMRGTITVRT